MRRLARPAIWGLGTIVVAMIIAALLGQMLSLNILAWPPTALLIVGLGFAVAISQAFSGSRVLTSLWRGAWAILAPVFGSIPAVLIGDSKGRVGGDKKEVGYAVSSHWAGAIVWVTILPAAIFWLGMNVWPEALWLELLIFPVGLFLFGRRFSAQAGTEMRVRDWYIRLDELWTFHTAELVERDPETGRRLTRREPVNYWRALAGTSMAVMAVAGFAGPWVPSYSYLLGDSASTIIEVASWWSAIFLLGFWLLLPLSWKAAVLHHEDAESNQSTEVVWRDRLRHALGVSEAEWIANRTKVTFGPTERTLTIAPVPVGARPRLPSLETELAKYINGWTVISADFDEIELALIEDHPEVQAARTAMAESEGLLARAPDILREATNATQEIHGWQAATDRRVTPAQLDALARDRGGSVIKWDPVKKYATVTVLPTDVRSVRDRLASLVDAEPWDVELSLDYAISEVGIRYISSVNISRFPEILDPVRRRRQWLLAAKTALDEAPGTLWRFDDDTTNAKITLRRIPDPLARIVTIAEFNERFPNPVTDPAESWKSFPIATTEDGESVPFVMFHTLCVGQTGTGKGSTWWAAFNGLLPAARAGLVEYYAVDPKGTEAVLPDGKGPVEVFEQIATNPDDWSALIERLAEDLEVRKGRGRSPAITRAFPLRVIFLDEMSALSMLDTDKRRAGEVMANLLKIASQGRSLNVLLVGLVQAPQKEMVGNLRDFMPMRVALRTGTKIETDLVLGEGATELGAEAHLIPVAGSGNGYASAGTGYMAIEGNPAPVRVRFPYTDDAQIEAWSDEFKALRAARRTAASEPLTENVGEFSFTLDDLADLADTTPAPTPPPLRRLRADGGVLDLASVLVSVLVLGLLSSVIATTLFGIIPWAQDGAARSNLQAVGVAQASERILSHSCFSFDNLSPTPTSSGEVGIVSPSAGRLLIDATPTGYLAASRSQFGAVFFSSNLATNVPESTWAGLPDGYTTARAEAVAEAVRRENPFVLDDGAPALTDEQLGSVLGDFFEAMHQEALAQGVGGFYGMTPEAVGFDLPAGVQVFTEPLGGPWPMQSLRLRGDAGTAAIITSGEQVIYRNMSIEVPAEDLEGGLDAFDPSWPLVLGNPVSVLDIPALTAEWNTFMSPEFSATEIQYPAHQTLTFLGLASPNGPGGWLPAASCRLPAA